MCKAEACGQGVMLRELTHFSADRTLDCGQAFRFTRVEGGWAGIVGGRRIGVFQTEDSLLLSGITLPEYQTFWADYFDLRRDYQPLMDRFSEDPTLKEACRCCPGIRVLRQEPWEALCSFIISQNNNIPRIKKIIEALCGAFGSPLADGSGYAFPTPEQLASRDVEEIFSKTRCGFRAKYLSDAALRVADGQLPLEQIPLLPLEEGRKLLMEVKGVGPKVADCVLLYGMGRVDAFPVDVWIGRILEQYYPEGFPSELFPWRGIAQQYLFHYIRTLPHQPIAG